MLPAFSIAGTQTGGLVTCQSRTRSGAGCSTHTNFGLPHPPCLLLMRNPRVLQYNSGICRSAGCLALRRSQMVTVNIVILGHSPAPHYFSLKYREKSERNTQLHRRPLAFHLLPFNQAVIQTNGFYDPKFSVRSLKCQRVHTQGRIPGVAETKPGRWGIGLAQSRWLRPLVLRSGHPLDDYASSFSPHGAPQGIWGRKKSCRPVELGSRLSGCQPMGSQWK